MHAEPRAGRRRRRRGCARPLLECPRRASVQIRNTCRVPSHPEERRSEVDDERRTVSKDAPDAPGRVTELVTECLDRLQGEGEAAAEELLRAHPEIAEAARRRLDKLRNMGLWVSPVALPRKESVPERLGGFRLIRPLG